MSESHTNRPTEQSPDPWEDHETAQLREFLALTDTERFHLLMQAIEFMNLLRPIEEKKTQSEP